MKMAPCKFTFDDETVYDGFAHGSTWNGFDNVAVTKELIDKFHKLYPEDGFNEIEPMKNGLYSLGWGFCTSIVREDA